MYQTGQFEVEQSFEGGVRMILGKIEKRSKRQIIGGLHDYTTAALYAFLKTFLYYSIVGRKATS